MTNDPNPMPNITPVSPITPTRKVGAGALAGALSVILVWAFGRAGVDIPAYVASAITVVLTFLVSYVVKEP